MSHCLESTTPAVYDFAYIAKKMKAENESLPTAEDKKTSDIPTEQDDWSDYVLWCKNQPVQFFISESARADLEKLVTKVLGNALNG
jgi:hypothetical protein